MMKEIKIKVPVDCEYLSMWKDFDTFLPPGHIILNKEICGCGCTDYFLTSGTPTILVSPRKRLIESKKNDPRTYMTFYYDRSKGNSVDETNNELRRYLDTCGEQPFGGGYKVPKLMVTYDSTAHMVEKLIEWNVIDKFEIIVDEFTCIFSDVRMKGFTEINLLHWLNRLPNRIVYISATPLKDLYLDILDEFKSMPYVTLEWDPSRVERVLIHTTKMVSTISEFGKILKYYNKNSFFNSKIVNGIPYYSKEGVFFLNSVRDIVAIIKKFGLTTANTLVICADDDKNRSALRKVGFKIGNVPGKIDYILNNKTFTFVTRCSFEGTDFFSDNSTTYVFSDCNRDNLALDISIDLPQIAGRCRTKDNVFRNEIFYYYKNADAESFDEHEIAKMCFEKKTVTEERVKQLSNINDPGILRKLSNAQKVEKYDIDYLDFVMLGEGTAQAVCNNLAFVADLRAIEIKASQYKNTYSLLCHMHNQGFSTTSQYATTNNDYNQFMASFTADANFERRMRLYVDTLQQSPWLQVQLEQASIIPNEFKLYFRELGPERIRRNGYIEANLRNELANAHRISGVCLNLKEGLVYSNAELKSMLQREYDRLGMNKTAKATDIVEFADAKECKIRVDGNRVYGYKILKVY